MVPDREVAVRVRNAEVTVVFPERPLPLSRERVIAWVQACGETVADYFGKFPVPQI